MVDLSILLTLIFQNFCIRCLMHQTKYMQKQSISGASLMAMPIYSFQSNEMYQKEKHHTKTHIFVSINWCRKSSVYHKDTKNYSHRKNSLFMLQMRLIIDQRRRQSIGKCKKQKQSYHIKTRH